jgi:hypothetical protein
MHRVIPDLIIENYRAGRLRGSFNAVSMFLDISGFSIVTDALMGRGRDGAEVLAVMMSAVFDPLVAGSRATQGIPSPPSSRPTRMRARPPGTPWRPPEPPKEP